MNGFNNKRATRDIEEEFNCPIEDTERRNNISEYSNFFDNFHDTNKEKYYSDIAKLAESAYQDTTKMQKTIIAHQNNGTLVAAMEIDENAGPKTNEQKKAAEFERTIYMPDVLKDLHKNHPNNSKINEYYNNYQERMDKDTILKNLAVCREAYIQDEKYNKRNKFMKWWYRKSHKKMMDNAKLLRDHMIKRGISEYVFERIQNTIKNTEIYKNDKDAAQNIATHLANSYSINEYLQATENQNKMIEDCDEIQKQITNLKKTRDEKVKQTQEIKDWLDAKKVLLGQFRANKERDIRFHNNQIYQYDLNIYNYNYSTLNDEEKKNYYKVTNGEQTNYYKKLTPDEQKEFLKKEEADFKKHIEKMLEAIRKAKMNIYKSKVSHTAVLSDDELDKMKISSDDFNKAGKDNQKLLSAEASIKKYLNGKEYHTKDLANAQRELEFYDRCIKNGFTVEEQQKADLDAQQKQAQNTQPTTDEQLSNQLFQEQKNEQQKDINPNEFDNLNINNEYQRDANQLGVQGNS